MATKPEKSISEGPSEKSGRVQDFFLEPLPVPEAHESDGETVWGMWEHSLEVQKQEAPPAWDETSFEKTELSPLDEPVPRPKK